MVEREKISWTKFGRDLYHLLCGRDGKLSIRRVLAVAFSGALIHMSILHITKCTEVQEAFIWAFVSLIVALLSLTTFQTIQGLNKKQEENE